MSKFKEVIKNKKIIFLVSGVLVLVIISLSFIFYPYTKLEKSMENYYNTVSPESGGWQFTKDRSPYKVMLCNFSLTEPEVVLIQTEIEDKYYYLELYKYSRSNVFSQDWKIVDIGTSVASDTTFSKLTSMIKEDCDQFKHSYPTSEHPRTDELSEISWIYSKPQTDEEKSQAEKEKEEREEFWNAIVEYLDRLNSEYESLDNIEEVFYQGMTEEEVQEIFDNLPFSTQEEITNKLDQYPFEVIFGYMLEKGYIEAR